MSNTKKVGTGRLRSAMILLIVVFAFVASYQLATASTARSATAGSAARGPAAALNAAGTSAGNSSLPCACCGGSGTGEKIEGAAVVENGVQKITVDTSNGYNPNTIKLTAGIPAEITFKQASGCLGQVQSKDFGFYEDLTTGDKTVRIEADKLQPGEYSFSCGMQMQFGTIVVE